MQERSKRFERGGEQLCLSQEYDERCKDGVSSERKDAPCSGRNSYLKRQGNVLCYETTYDDEHSGIQ